MRANLWTAAANLKSKLKFRLNYIPSPCVLDYGSALRAELYTLGEMGLRKLPISSTARHRERETKSHAEVYTERERRQVRRRCNPLAIRALAVISDICISHAAAAAAANVTPRDRRFTCEWLFGRRGRTMKVLEQSAMGKKKEAEHSAHLRFEPRSLCADNERLRKSRFFILSCSLSLSLVLSLTLVPLIFHKETRER